MTRDAVALTTSGKMRRCIEALRRERGWNQTQLAVAVGRSQQWVSRLEKGSAEVSVGDVLNALASLGADVVLRDVGPQSTQSTLEQPQAHG